MCDQNAATPHKKGQSLIEFAFGMVVLVIMLAGIFDGGRALFTYMALRDAAQEGAEFGSTNPTQTAAIKNRVRNSSNTTSDLFRDPTADTEIRITFTGAACTGNGITVQTIYRNFKLTMPFLGTLIGRQTVPISASITDSILAPTCP